MFAGSFAFLQEQPVPDPGDHRRQRCSRCSLAVVHDAGAVVAVEERRYVGILYAGITFFTTAIFGALYAITGTSRVSWISIGANLAQVIDVIFRLTPRYATPWQVSLLVLIGLVVVSISVLERRVRGVEVVT